MNTLDLYIKVQILYRRLLDSYQVLKPLENQELINAETKDAKYVKIV